MISAPLVAAGMYFAIPSSVSTLIKSIVPIAAFSIWMLAVLGGVFLLSLVLSPYKQRNEACSRVLELESEIEDKKQREQLRQDLIQLVLEGTNVLHEFKSYHPFRDAWHIKEYLAWCGNGSAILLKHGLTDECALWLRDVDINTFESQLPDFIRACEAGLDRLEGILATLRN